MSDIIVDKSKLKHYKFKIKVLSPVHIGTGEAYEPTEYVIDERKLHAFDPILFFKSLPQIDKEAFDKKIHDYMQIIDFYKSKKEQAKQVAFFECAVSSEVNNAYNKQNNKDGTKNKNQLEIEKTFKNPNTHRPIIPGSSIKGMLDTVLQIYPQKIKENTKRQNLIISDAILLNGGVEIGKAIRKHKDPSSESKQGIDQRIEVIKPQSEFVLSMATPLTLQALQDKLQRYHSKRKESRYKQTKNTFVARVGKNEGKIFMVDEATNVLNHQNKPVMSHFLYSSDSLQDEEFGWVEFEHIDDKYYEEALNSIAIQEKEYYQNLEQKQKILKQDIAQKQQELALQKRLKEEAKRKEEQEKLQKAKEEQEYLSKLSPTMRTIEELCKKHADMPRHTVIYKFIDNEGIENRCEALAQLKATMQSANKWKESSNKKNPAKDKEYNLTLEIIQMIKECK